MELAKRRGRPAGTDYKEDLEALALVADRLIGDEGQTPWPVMWAVCKTRKWKGSTDQAIVARWLRKWKVQSSMQLTAARQRRVDRQTTPLTVSIRSQMVYPESLRDVSANLKRVHAEMAAAVEPVRRAMEQMARDVDASGIRAFCEQQTKLAKAFAASPVFEEMQRISEQIRNLPPIRIPNHISGRLIWNVLDSARAKPVAD